jgi:glutaredoxin-like protein NrdH
MTPTTGAVPGEAGQVEVVFYGLSTCVWCRKMREYLESEGVTFRIIYVDKLTGAEREAALREVRRWNPATTFPTVVVGGTRSINGYKPDEVREVLGL